MAKGNSKILTAEQEQILRQPIEDYVGKIQAKIDALRVDGTDKVIALQSKIDAIKRDRTITKDEKESGLQQCGVIWTRQKLLKQSIRMRFQN